MLLLNFASFSQVKRVFFRKVPNVIIVKEENEIK